MIALFHLLWWVLVDLCALFDSIFKCVRRYWVLWRWVNGLEFEYICFAFLGVFDFIVFSIFVSWEFVVLWPVFFGSCWQWMNGCCWYIIMCLCIFLRFGFIIWVQDLGFIWFECIHAKYTKFVVGIRSNHTTRQSRRLSSNSYLTLHLASPMLLSLNCLIV